MRRRPPLQSCNAHGPYRAWRPVCPDCVREQPRQPVTFVNRDGSTTRSYIQKSPPVPYNEFPPGFGEP